MSDPRDEQVVDLLKRDDPQAWREIVRRFRPPLVGFVRRRLPAQVRRRFDSEDIVQEALRRMIALARRVGFGCESDDCFWQILRAVAFKQLQYELRRQHAASRDVDREADAASSFDSGLQAAQGATDHHPGPEELVSLLDEFLALVDKLDLRAQVIMHVRHQDLTVEETANEMGCSERTMKRLWEELCRKCRAIREREEQSVEDARKEGNDDPEGEV